MAECPRPLRANASLDDGGTYHWVGVCLSPSLLRKFKRTAHESLILRQGKGGQTDERAFRHIDLQRVKELVRFFYVW